jgi:homospermidine synthase
MTSFSGNMVIVGWGTIAKASLPLILRHTGISPKKITVVTAEQTDKDIATQHGIQYITNPLDGKNNRKILDPLLKPGDFLLNLSVDVSSVDLARIALDKGAAYMDTCVEPAANGYTEGTLADRTNYMLREQALALKKEYGKGAPTALFAHGINPGLISSILKQALVNIAVDTKHPNFTEPKTKQEWANLMHKLGVKVVHIAERDTQVTKSPKKYREFVNTWSSDGFISEGVFQPAELGWGTHEKELPSDAKQHTTGSKSAIYLQRPGAATRVRTWTPIEKSFNGFLVTHNESISIAEYFSVYEKDKVVFRPTVHYAYHPSDIAVLSVDELLGNDSIKPDPKLIRVAMDEITDGHDELGVLVMGHSNVSYWFGSVQDVHTARSLAPYNNATSLQVAAGVLAGVVHVIENPKEGIIEAEDVHYKRAIEVSKPYLGKLVGAYSDWTPIKHYNKLFDRPVDLSCPFQFKNFRVH